MTAATLTDAEIAAICAPLTQGAAQVPDGTWNHDRESCRLIAAEALGQYDDDAQPDALEAIRQARSF